MSLGFVDHSTGELVPVQRKPKAPSGGAHPPMAGTRLRAKEAAEWAAANHDDFTKIDLSGRAMFNSADAVAIAQALETNTHVEEVHLAGLGLLTSVAVAFGEMLKHNESVKVLNLENNKITNDGIAAIAEGLAYNDTLEQLTLFKNKEPGQSALEVLVLALDFNTRLLNINWRLTSRQSFAINKKLIRNKELLRLKKAGRDTSHLDPNAHRAARSGDGGGSGGGGESSSGRRNRNRYGTVHPSKPSEFDVSLSVVLDEMDASDVTSLWKKLQRPHSDCAVAHPYLTDVAVELQEKMVAAFDQYTGLRQVGDLRGLPQNGPKVYQAGTAAVNRLQLLTTACLTWVFAQVHEDVVHRGGKLFIMGQISTHFAAVLDQYVEEYATAIRALLRRQGVQSSKVATVASGETYNEHYKDLLIGEIIAATGGHEKKVRADVEAKIALIDERCPEGVRTKIFAAVGGRDGLRTFIDAQLEQLRPWAIEWLKVQKDAVALREVFGKDDAEMRQRLDESMRGVVAGFENCMDTMVVLPLVEIGDKLETIERMYKDYVRDTGGGAR